jgi:hypothetical protein
MTITRQSLAAKFQLFNDSELLGLFHSGELTDTAHDVAGAELKYRGIDLAAPKVGAPSEQPDGSFDDLPRGGEGDLVPIARFFTPIEGHMLRGRLAAEGVPAMVADAHLVQANPFLAVAVGGVRVLVPDSHVDRAREIVKAIDSGGYALDEHATGE